MHVPPLPDTYTSTPGVVPNRRPRGARPSPRHALCGATPHRVVGATPAQWCWIPSKLSYWHNDTDGICVTAEEAFCKACSGILVSDAEVLRWATAHGVVNGADLASVLDWMRSGGFQQDGNVYDDGGKVSVDWTNPALLQNAIAQGPVKIAVAANQLENVVWGNNGWLATGFSTDTSTDHCVALCGYGNLAWCLAQLGGGVPAGMDGTQPAYMLFTWKTIGVIDVKSMLAITAEAWLRNPATVTVGTHPPTPDVVKTPATPTPTPNPIPGPGPTPNPSLEQVIAAVDAAFVALEKKNPWYGGILKQVNQSIDAAIRRAWPTAGRLREPAAPFPIGQVVLALVDGAIAGVEVQLGVPWAPVLETIRPYIDEELKKLLGL